MMTFSNAQTEDSQLFLYKRRHTPVEGMPRGWFPANASQLERIHMKAWKMLFSAGFPA